jgi:hypothetical protein
MFAIYFICLLKLKSQSGTLVQRRGGNRGVVDKEFIEKLRNDYRFNIKLFYVYVVRGITQFFKRVVSIVVGPRFPVIKNEQYVLQRNHRIFANMKHHFSPCLFYISPKVSRLSSIAEAMRGPSIYAPGAPVSPATPKYFKSTI